MDYFNNKRYHKSSHRCECGGICHCFEFPNGYGAKVAQNPRTCGYEYGLWELGVTYEGKFVYDTPIHTELVLGWLTNEEVEQLLQKISEFPLKRMLNLA